jgi:hypothetical protein
METWTWTKMVDEDKHPFWRGRSNKGGAVVIWRAGGDSGEYITEGDERRKTLKGAKAVAQTWAENQQ